MVLCLVVTHKPARIRKFEHAKPALVERRQIAAEAFSGFNGRLFHVVDYAELHCMASQGVLKSSRTRPGGGEKGDRSLHARRPDLKSCFGSRQFPIITSSCSIMLRE